RDCWFVVAWERRSRVGRSLCFFFQAEDGIRDRNVTGVQTCALPIWLRPAVAQQVPGPAADDRGDAEPGEQGRQQSGPADEAAHAEHEEAADPERRGEHGRHADGEPAAATARRHHRLRARGVDRALERAAVRRPGRGRARTPARTHTARTTHAAWATHATRATHAARAGARRGVAARGRLMPRGSVLSIHGCATSRWTGLRSATGRTRLPQAGRSTGCGTGRRPSPSLASRLSRPSEERLGAIPRTWPPGSGRGGSP